MKIYFVPVPFSLALFFLWESFVYGVITANQGRSLFKEGSSFPHFQTFQQTVFLKDEFSFLNVPRIATLEAFDVFDCTFECITNRSCLSVNLAASKGKNGKLWCELLSSDKYRNTLEYKGNDTSHHYHMKSPCESSPCLNGGTCMTNYNNNSFECLCEASCFGKYCEKVVRSCKDLYDACRSNKTQLVTLHFTPNPILVLCHMGDFGCGDGGWTPVMKIDGKKGTFHYDSGFWSDKKKYNLPGGKTGFDSQETKLPTYWNTSFSKICLGMKIGQQIEFIVISKTADSLYSLIADGKYRSTWLGRDTWKTLIGSQAYLQQHCNREGFNAVSGDSSMGKARIGYLANNENDCRTCDSRIGFGTGGRHDDTNTCGNEGSARIKAMGYILVQ